MNIAHVVWGMETGGVETMLVNIINEQVKTEEVALFIINDFVDESVIGALSSKCRVSRLNRKPGSKNPLEIVKLNWWIWRFKPDIVHVHSYKVSTLLKGGWNIVRTIHGIDNIPTEYPKMKALYSISDAVKDFTKGQGFESTTIANGIQADAFNRRKVTEGKPDVLRIVVVSRLYIKDKGQDILIDAAKLLRDRDMRAFDITFIGEGSSKDELESQVARLGLGDCIHFLGKKSQDYIKEHLCDYDLFVQPSRSEGFGLTVAEAMAAQVPVLVSDIYGPMEVIGHGTFGMYFKTEDPLDLANKIECIINNGYPSGMVDKAWLHVRELYDVSVTAQKYINEYKKITR